MARIALGLVLLAGAVGFAGCSSVTPMTALSSGTAGQLAAETAGNAGVPAMSTSAGAAGGAGRGAMNTAGGDSAGNASAESASADAGAGAGRGGRDGAGGSGASSGAGSTASGCAERGWLLCEDFEGTDLGGVPRGWTQHGDLVTVDDADAHGGSHALRLGPAANAERRIYHDAKLLGSAHWGRIYYKVQTPVPDAFVHSTLVSLIGNGPKNGRSDYRPIDTIKQAKDTKDVGGRHDFIYNVQIIGKSEFGTETHYDYTFDAKWHCAEYHLDSSDQSYTLYFDGEDVLHFTHGAGNYDDSDIPTQFDELRIGWINYQSAPPGFTAFIDDIAFDDARIGCD